MSEVPRTSPSSNHDAIQLTIAWGDMDALGHVNNVVYFRYMESARVAFIRALGWKDPAAGSGHLGRDGVGFILQAAQCRFRRPLEYPDTIRVTSRVVSVADDRFTIAHEIISDALNDVAALGEGTIVTYDYTRKAKVPIPAELRALLEAQHDPHAPARSATLLPRRSPPESA